MSNAQEVRLSDDATWMSRRNDSNFSKRAGKQERFGSPFFWYLFFGEAKKRYSPGGETKSIGLRECNIAFSYACRRPHFSLLVQRKVSKRKDTRLAPVSCASQIIAVVPVRHPCRIVTKTNFLFVFPQFSCDARGTHMGPIWCH